MSGSASQVLSKNPLSSLHEADFYHVPKTAREIRHNESASLVKILRPANKATEDRTKYLWLPEDTVLTAELFKKPVQLHPGQPAVKVDLGRVGLPSGHIFYIDEEREQHARFFQWAMERKGIESWFGTLTFENFTRQSMAEAKCDQFMARLDQAIRDYLGSRLTSIRATEWQRRDVIHFHLLLMASGLHSLSRKRYEVRWAGAFGRFYPHSTKRVRLSSGLGGGFCRIYNAEVGAAPYLAKELNKTRNGEMRLGGSWREHCPASVNVNRQRFGGNTCLADVTRRAEGNS